MLRRADIEAYFRTVNVQIRDWQENRGGDADDTDPNNLSYCKAYNHFWQDYKKVSHFLLLLWMKCMAYNNIEKIMK